MNYIGWAVLYEGSSDAAYFDILIHRMMEDAVFRGDKLPVISTEASIRLRRGSPADFATEACGAQDAFDLIFLHSDTGGRNQQGKLDERTTRYSAALTACCDWPTERCVFVTPRHETEAWVLGDSAAVCEALGYRGDPIAIGLPADAVAAERLVDPKAVLNNAIRQVRNGRRASSEGSQIFAAVAQRQRLDLLRQASSFQQFELRLRVALAHIGAL